MKGLLDKSILKVLVYFDMFQYPVSIDEIRFFIDQKAGEDEIADALKHMILDQRVYRIDKFYTLRNNFKLIERRIKGNIYAGNLLKKAYAIAAFLYKFPYVRGIGISGSLSKNFADEDADIDFFVITKKNRLWLARTAMHMFKKLTFLVGKQDWFCMNYYVDEDALLIEERNMFTAMELITLLPACGNGVMGRFFDVNEWARDYYPRYEELNHSSKRLTHDVWYKRMIEWLLNNKLGDSLDNYFLRLTSRRWKKKEENFKLNVKGNRMGLRTGKHYAKPNPRFFQEKILMLYQSKLNDYDITEAMAAS
ncbi:MAG: hypothetical protein C5B52_11340 [Bacteroidetes bacterium]|nr:MAG: hypothetical protein C5B52_11340 [Bacteroidota bacterium]